MTSTRVDTAKLTKAVAQATDHILKAEALLAPYLLALPDKERRRLPKARAGFLRAGRQLARAVADFPGLAAAADVEPEALVAHLDNVDALTPLAQKIGVLSQRLSDSRLSWLAEAWTAALRVHRVAKVLARTNGRMRTVVKPMAEVFPTRRVKKAKRAVKAAA